MEYRVIRSSRRTVAIHITPEGGVEVRAPYRVPVSFIEELIHSKAAWIEEKTAAQRQRQMEKQAFALKEGTQLLLWGRPVTIALRQELGKPLLNDGLLLMPSAAEEAQRRTLVETFYREVAHEKLPERVKIWSTITGLCPAVVHITGAKTRWGSCSGKNSVNFSWRLVTAPPAAVDYVVLHELCHLVHHDHSPAFWALVSHWMPDYKARKALLREIQDAALLL